VSGALVIAQTWFLPDRALERPGMAIHLALLFMVGSFGLASMERATMEGSLSRGGCWFLSWVGAGLVTFLIGVEAGGIWIVPAWFAVACGSLWTWVSSNKMTVRI
jgi:hypothetical protein